MDENVHQMTLFGDDDETPKKRGIFHFPLSSRVTISK